jgi:two-component system chemotaxis response regulator CheB
VAPLDKKENASGVSGSTTKQRARRDVIAIGGSAGALDAMMATVAGLPRDFGGSVFVVSHIGSHRSHLPELLSRSGPLPARHPNDGETICPGIVYVAPPDRHMLVLPGVIRLSRGPRQHFTRPAIDPLFRSVARALGPRVIGVVLSGTGSDGARGLWEVQQAGGITVIQEPSAALYPDMPRNAAKTVRPDHLVGIGELSQLLVRLSAETVDIPVASTAEETGTMIEQFERPVALTCPECGGAVRRTGDGSLVEFRCHTGHHFGIDEIAEGQRSALEEALVVAVRVLNERVELCRQMMDSARDAGRDMGVAYWQRLKDEAKEQLEVLVQYLEHQPPPAEAEPNGDRTRPEAIKLAENRKKPNGG